MKRRDFNRAALGLGLTPLLANRSLAQWYEGPSPPASAPPKKFNIVIKNSPRTYNQVNVPRKYGAGRRFSIYWTWSYPWEANRDVAELDNRFSTMTEVRRVAWPNYETPEFSEKAFLQGIGGVLELFHLSTIRFQNIVGEVTGQPVVVYQRIDQAGQRLPIDERMLADTDTLMVFGLDHMITEQEAAPEEIEAIKQFLTREGTCLLLSPHHDVGASRDPKRLQMEYVHHGDPLVPRQQRFRPLHAQPHERSRGAGGEPVWSSPGSHQGHEPASSPHGHARSGHASLAGERDNVQFSPAPAALRIDHGGHKTHSRIGSAADRFDKSAPIH